MQEFVCIEPFGGHLPGDVIGVPDGAVVSPDYYAPADDPQARRFAEKTPAEAVRTAVEALEPPRPDTDPPETPEGVSEPPESTKAGK